MNKKLIICSINKVLIVKVGEEFKNRPIEIKYGSIFDQDVDTIVSPANSFGFMDGSLDWHISERLGWDIQEKLQKQIKEKYNGELLVGNAELVETSHPKIKYVISAPSMRVPMRIKGTVNCYLATKAALTLIKNDDRIKSAVIPCFGTGVGKLEYETCARQMRVAYDEVILQEDNFPKSWQDSVKKHKYLICGKNL